MLVYRIVKDRKRARDLSGTGAFYVGGRWNSEGTYALYTSENPSLALLELLVHADESEFPPNLFLLTIRIDDKAPIAIVPDKDLPLNWRVPDNLALKQMGDRLFEEKMVLGIKVRSAVMPNQYNYVFNPLFAGYAKYLKVINIA